jgi:hypothetical protein
LPIRDRGGAVRAGGFVGAFLVELLLLVLRDAAEARFDEAEVTDGKFEVDLVDISQWIDAAFGVEHGRVFKRPDDVTEGVHVLEFVKRGLSRLGFVGWGRGERVTSISAYFVFFGLYIAVSLSMRGSATLTLPTWNSPGRPRRWSRPMPVINEKTVFLPVCGNPISAIFTS